MTDDDFPIDESSPEAQRANPIKVDFEAQQPAHVNGVSAKPDPWPVLDVAGIFAALEPVPYLAKVLDLCPGAPALFAGYGFSGKTVALQSAALSIATGQLIWGAYTARQGRVVHVDYEQGARLTRERYQRLAIGMGLGPTDLEDRLSLVSMPAIYMDDAGNEATLVAKCTGADLVIVDSLRAACPKLEENDSNVRHVLDMMNRVSGKTGACFVVIHHARKPSRDEAKGGGGARMAIRGSGAIYDGCSSVFVLEGEPGEHTKVSHVKARTSGILTPSFNLHIEDEEVGGNPRAGLRVIAEGIPTAYGNDAATAAATDELKRFILDALAAGPQRSKDAIATLIGKQASKVRPVVDLLISSGDLLVIGPRTRSEIYLRGTEPRAI